MDPNAEPIYETIDKILENSGQRNTRQSLQSRFDEECPYSLRPKSQSKNSTLKVWSDTISSSISNVQPRQALRQGAEKLTQTINQVRTTFGTLSQKLRKSTRRRQQLKCIDSPITPTTKSRQVLGRTPTKLYSPFGIDTPRGKENMKHLRRYNQRRLSPRSNCLTQGKSQCWFPAKECFAPTTYSPNRRFNHSQETYSPSRRFANDLVDTQIGIYEFQSTANKIIRRSLRN